MFTKLKLIILKITRKNEFQSKLNLIETFSNFKPHGNQPYNKFEDLIIKNINQIIPKISHLSERKKPVEIVQIDEFFRMNKHNETMKIFESLEKSFNFFKSDKAINKYHKIYSVILKHLDQDIRIFEVGMGTNNPNIVSSMGINGSPGASLKSFKNTFTNALVYGADIDRDILFSENRINTVFIDQNDLKTFENIKEATLQKFDLIIDDGLHYQLSNLNTLIFALENLNKNGYFIIEDIGLWTLDTWKIVQNLLANNFSSTIIQMTDNNFVFLVQRLD